VFGSDRLGVAVQAFVDHLRENGRSWSTCAGYVKSFVVVARFVHAVRVARAQQQGSGGSSGAAQEASATAATAATSTTVSTMPVDDMQRAHKQIMQQARLEQKFAEAKKPGAWLDWSAVIAARAHAVREYEKHIKHKDKEGGDEQAQRKRLFDATLLVWLTSVPPDRVKVARTLQLGGSLKPTADGGFDLDLATPDAHKTAAIFGPSRTPVPEAACALLKAWVAAAGLTAAAKPYVFVLGGGGGGGGGGGIGPAGHAQPVADKRWTEVVQGVLKRHSGVAMAPKDLRASFITFLMSDANTDEQLKKAVAHAMRHAAARQQGAAYDKEKSERLWAAAVKVAGDYAAAAAAQSA